MAEGKKRLPVSGKSLETAVPGYLVTGATDQENIESIAQLVPDKRGAVCAGGSCGLG